MVFSGMRWQRLRSCGDSELGGLFLHQWVRHRILLRGGKGTHHCLWRGNLCWGKMPTLDYGWKITIFDGIHICQWYLGRVNFKGFLWRSNKVPFAPVKQCDVWCQETLCISLSWLNREMSFLKPILLCWGLACSGAVVTDQFNGWTAEE